VPSHRGPNQRIADSPCCGVLSAACRSGRTKSCHQLLTTKEPPAFWPMKSSVRQQQNETKKRKMYPDPGIGSSWSASRSDNFAPGFPLDTLVTAAGMDGNKIPCSVHLRAHKNTTRHQPNRDKSSPNSTSVRHTLILSSNVCLGLRSGIFHLGFPTKILHAVLISSMRTTCPVRLDFSIETRLRARSPAGEGIFFSSPPRPDRLWSPLSLLSKTYQGLFPLG